jgi:type IV secretory pathway VirJ component
MLRMTYIQKHRKLLIFFLIIFALGLVAGMLMSKRKQNHNEEIAKLYKNHPSFRSDNLSDLPLLHFESKKNKCSFMVIMLPGDGGWRSLESTIADHICANGIPVIGLNTSPYFSTTRQPQEVAKDLCRIFEHFGSVFGKDSIVLLGYSFSAEILPFVYNQMDSITKSKVIKIVMLASSNGADFKTSPIYYYDPAKSKPVLPELTKIKPSKLILICDHYDASISKVLPHPNPYQTIKVNYNHLFWGHTGDIAKLLITLITKIE